MTKIEKYLWYGTAGLFIYMPFHIFLSQWLSTFTGGLDAWKIGKDVFTAILVLACVATVLIQKKFTKLYLTFIAVIASYLLLHIILVFTTNQPKDTGFLALTYNVRLFAYLMIGYSLALLSPKIKYSDKLAKILIVVSTIVCMVALLQWIAPKDLMTHFGYNLERGVKPAFFIDDKPDLPRVMSTLRDPNSLGAFLILPIMLLVSQLVKFWRTNRRMFLSGLLLLHVLVLWLTFSRGALLGIIAAFGALLVLKNSKNTIAFAKKYAPYIAIMLVILIAFAAAMRDQYVVQNIIFHSDENTKLENSNELHYRLAKEGLEGIVNNPEGNGPGTAGLVAIQTTGFVTENYFIQIGYEVGVLGLLIFIALLYLIIKNLWRNREDEIVTCLLASLVGLVVMNSLFHTWSNEAVSASWFILAGTCLVFASKKPTKPSKSLRVRR